MPDQPKTEKELHAEIARELLSLERRIAQLPDGPRKELALGELVKLYFLMSD